MWKDALLWCVRFLRALNDVDGDVVAQRVWRRSMASAMTLVLLVIAGSFVWAQGWIPGMSGVALADTVHELRLAQDGTAYFIVKSALHDALASRCLAIYRQNQPALDAANRDVDAAVDNYKALKHEAPALPDCSVVLIRDNTAHP